MDKNKVLVGNKLNETLLGGDGSLRHKLLVAMPGVQGDSFIKSVIYMCAHSPSGAMGIVINQRMPDVKFRELLAQLNLPQSELKVDPIVHFGGPVESGRGFVLHSTDFVRDDTVRVSDGIGITGTVEILKAIANGQGPDRSVFALGYAGWGPGQLDAEMQANLWLTVPADDELIFGTDLTGKWERALRKAGVTPLNLSSEIGHA